MQLKWDYYTRPKYQHCTAEDKYGGEWWLGHQKDREMVEFGYRLPYPPGENFESLIDKRSEKDPKREEYWREANLRGHRITNSAIYSQKDAKDIIDTIYNLEDTMRIHPEWPFAKPEDILEVHGFKNPEGYNEGIFKKKHHTHGTFAVFLRTDDLTDKNEITSIALIFDKPKSMHWRNLLSLTRKQPSHSMDYMIPSFWPEPLHSHFASVGTMLAVKMVKLYIESGRTFGPETKAFRQLGD